MSYFLVKKNMENSYRIPNSIEKLSVAMNNKYQNIFIILSTKTLFTQLLSPSIVLHVNWTYKAAMKSFSVDISIRNVSKDGTDTIRYSHDNGSTWTTITIFPGRYNSMEIIIGIYRQTS